MKKQITLDDGQIVIIDKLPIGKYAELLSSMQELPKKFDLFIDVEKSKMIEILPKIIGESLPEVLKIIDIATPLEPDEIDKLGLSEVVDILIGIALANNYSKVFDQIKKAMPQGDLKNPVGTVPKTL